ncbi:hypothetical protein Dimus_007814 [Dionaea muscipula]
MYGFGSQEQARALGVNLFPQSLPSVESRAGAYPTQPGQSSTQPGSMSMEAVNVLVNNLMSSVVQCFDERLKTVVQKHGITTPIEPTTWMQLLPPHLRPSAPPPPASNAAPPPASSAPQENNDDDDGGDFMMEVVDVVFVDLPSVEAVDMIWFVFDGFGYMQQNSAEKKPEVLRDY